MSRDTSDQISDLQTRFAFQEDSIHKLSEALYQQQCRIDGLEQQVASLKQALEKEHSSDSGTALEQEKPPHY